MSTIVACAACPKCGGIGYRKIDGPKKTIPECVQNQRRPAPKTRYRPPSFDATMGIKLKISAMMLRLRREFLNTHEATTGIASTCPRP